MKKAIEIKKEIKEMITYDIGKSGSEGGLLW